VKEFNVVNSFLQLPDAGDATDGFPQIDVTTTTKNARMTIARTRADMFINPPGFKTIDEAKDELLSYYENFAGFFDQQSKNKIVRIGFVTRHILKHSEPSEALTKLLSVDPIDLLGGKKSGSVVVRFETKIEIAGFLSNNIAKMETGFVEQRDNGIRISGVLTERDINTEAETKYDLKKNNIVQFLKQAINILNLNELEASISDE